MDHKAFTYLEMLIVLLIVSILLLFPINMLDDNRKKIESEYELFTINYNYYRSLVLSETNCSIEIGENYYQIICDNLHIKTKTDYLSFSTNYTSNIINFNEKGNVSRAGTVIITAPNFYKELSVNIMSGSLNEK